VHVSEQTVYLQEDFLPAVMIQCVLQASACSSTYNAAYTDSCRANYTITACTTVFQKMNPRFQKYYCRKVNFVVLNCIIPNSYPYVRWPQLLKQCVRITEHFLDMIRILIPNPVFNYMSKIYFLNFRIILSSKFYLTICRDIEKGSHCFPSKE